MNASMKSTFNRARGLLRRVRAQLPHRRRPAILMYHRVAEERFDPWGLAVSPANFRAQINWLAADRTLLPLDEFVARHKEGTLPEAATAITFDDGYACFADVAAPILWGARAPATVFLPAALVESGAPFWWDELQTLVLGTNREALRLEGQSVSLGDARPEDVDWAPGKPPRTARQAAFLRLWALLRPMRPRQLEVSLQELREQAEVEPSGANVKRPMRPEEIRAVCGSGIAAGSHALTHPWLTSLNREEKRREIQDSLARVEALAGSSVSAFAYPYGNFDRESEDLTQDAGFTFACATIPGPVTSASRTYALPRLHVQNISGAKFERFLALAGA